ncbi:hypothetical protein KY289_017347 [Solanum tuberosum]|nr:hypothetical protein KY289_017347 [Solanum tuberosum]
MASELELSDFLICLRSNFHIPTTVDSTNGSSDEQRANQPAIDCSLITALVERWRPETHTFHFRTGEATTTLQDVEELYELPVNGFIPSREDFKTNYLKDAAFNAYMRSQPELPNTAKQDMINQKAKCYMFWMIAGMLMMDTSGGYLKLILPKMKIGFLPLLQIWAWERVTVLNPQIVAKKDARTVFVDFSRSPHTTRWFAHLSWTNTTKHMLKVYRDALDSMIEEQFIWEPYPDDLIESLPVYCHAGRNIWRIRVPIFCWNAVEVDLPDRVMRQFGLQQVIPTPFPFDSTHFCHDRRGRPNTN